MPPLLLRSMRLVAGWYHMLALIPLTLPILGSKIAIQQTPATDGVLDDTPTRDLATSMSIAQAGKTRPLGIGMKERTTQRLPASQRQRVWEVGGLGWGYTTCVTAIDY